MLNADVKIDSRVPITEDTSSPQTYEQIHTWLDTCKNEHPECRASLGSASLPTRLIYLNTSRVFLSNQVGMNLQPRLVSTDGMEYSECRYITLSYRWPEDFPTEAKSTRDNIYEQMRGLKTSRLPRIFNDVFQVAVKMGISYVWIDSLCIVQDDPEDWNREAALMIQIYRYAEFTVAAAAPPTKPDLGLFRHGDPSDVLSVRLPGIVDPREDGTGQEVVVMKPQKETYGESPLVSRGWCFQEREISRRIVHYTDTQVLWECRTVQASEGLPNGIPEVRPWPHNGYKTRDESWPDRMLDNEISSGRVDDSWRRAVEDYSARHLSVFTDKLPALAGLAAAIQDYKPANSRYLAGLWESDFVEGLQWFSRADRHFTYEKNVQHRTRTITNTRYPEYVAPTWSWASVAGPVSYIHTPDDYTQYVQTSDYHLSDYNTSDVHTSAPESAESAKYALKVLDVYVQTSTDDPFGAVRHTVLTCTAGLVPGVLGPKISPSDDYDYDVGSAKGQRIGGMDFDAPQEKYNGEGVEVVFCIKFAGDDNGPGLVVVPTGDRENEYRRVGWMDHMYWHEFFEAEIREITIV